MKFDKIIFSTIVILLVGILYFQLAGARTHAVTSNVFLNGTTSHDVSLNVPAVDNNENGVVTVVTVDATPGTGKALVDVDHLLLWTDTQQSIQTAKAVAQNITQTDLSHVDLIYTIQTNASSIEGPSAGAALTIATVAAVEGRQLNNSVMITGTINPDGSIGQIGGVVQKAAAAKEIGAKLFLVPVGQSTQTNYVPEQQCQQYDSYTICSNTYQQQTQSVANTSGITIQEVSDIQDALKYFLL